MFDFKYFFLSAAAMMAAIGWAETNELIFPIIFFMLIGAVGAAIYEDIRRIN